QEEVEPVLVLLGHLPRFEQGDDGLNGVLRAGGVEGEGQLLRVAAEGELAGLELGHPVRFEFADGQPQGVVEDAVHRHVESGQGGGYGFRIGTPPKDADRLQSHSWMVIAAVSSEYLYPRSRSRIEASLLSQEANAHRPNARVSR